MKLRFALVGLVALGGAALAVGTASAMPLAPLGQSQPSNVESVALVCGRTVVFARRLSTGTAATASAEVMATACAGEAMPTDIVGDIAATENKT